MAQSSEKQARSAAPEGETPAHEPKTCPVAWCPVCFAVTALQPVSPEVIEHFLKAGTELFLAMRAVVDGRADDLEPEASEQPVRLEKIDVG
jgi:hypothetical protein